MLRLHGRNREALREDQQAAERIFGDLRGRAVFIAISVSELPRRLRPNKLYLERVHAAGGWKRYAQAHRLRLTKTFARVVFPSVPEELVAHIVDLWAHVGYY